MAEILDVLWDWNGTLLDDAPLHLDILNELRVARGLAAVDLDHYRREFVLPAARFCERLLGLDGDPKALSDVAAAWMERYSARWRDCPLVPGAEDALDALRAAGVRSSILSATQQDFLRTQVAHHRLVEKVASVAGTGTLLSTGKDERGRKLLAELDAHPGSTVLVGDTEHDLDVARALGVECLLFDFGHANVDHLRRAGVPVFGSLAEAVHFITSRRAPN